MQSIPEDRIPEVRISLPAASSIVERKDLTNDIIKDALDRRRQSNDWRRPTSQPVLRHAPSFQSRRSAAMETPFLDLPNMGTFDFQNSFYDSTLSGYPRYPSRQASFSRKPSSIRSGRSSKLSRRASSTFHSRHTRTDEDAQEVLQDEADDDYVIAPEQDEMSMQDYATAVTHFSVPHFEDTPADVWLKSFVKDKGLLAVLKEATLTETLLMVLGIVFALGSGVLRPIVTLIFGMVSNSLTSSSSDPNYESTLRSNASHQALYVVYLGIASMGASFTFMTIFSWTGESITRRLRVKYLSAVLHQDGEFYDRVGDGEMAERIQQDLTLIQDGISEKLPLTAVFISNCIAGFIVAVTASWRLALSLLTMLPLIFLSVILSKMYTTKYGRSMLEQLGKASSLADEIFSSMRVVKAFGMEHALSKLYTEYLQTARHDSQGKKIVQAASVGFNYFVLYSGYALAFFYGTLLITRGQALPGDVVTTFFAQLVAFIGLASITPCLEALGLASAAAARIYRHIDRTPSIQLTGQSLPVGMTGRIEFDEVSFQYPTRRSVTVLKNFSALVQPKTTTALCGGSGSGKSTIVGLLERFYDYSGSIKIDNVEIRSLHPKMLRSIIGYLTQEPLLFDRTIFENVALGLVGTIYENVSAHEMRKHVLEACQEANAHDFIVALDEGYETSAGERGCNLSGGQIQRICLARALVAKPSILLLDEATSALDSHSEATVAAALAKAASTRTCITIAHRLSTIREADQIIVMHQGVVVEKGTHEQLLQREGRYFELCNAQAVEQAAQPQDVDAQTISSKTLSMSIESTKDSMNTDSTLFNYKSLPSSTLEALPYVKSSDLLPISRRKTSPISWTLSLVSDSYPLFFSAIALVGLFGLAYPALAVVLGFTLQSYTNAFAQGVSAHELNLEGGRFALYFFIIALASVLIYSLASGAFAIVTERLALTLRYRVMIAIMSKPFTWLDKSDNSPNSLLTFLSQNPANIVGLFGPTLQAVIESCFTLIGGIVISLCFGWKLALVALATVPITLALGILRVQSTSNKTAKTEKILTESCKYAIECIGGIKTVQSLVLEEYVLEEFKRKLDAATIAILRYSLLNGLIFASSAASLYFVIALTFWYGMILLASGEYSVKAFYIVFLAITLGSSHASTIFLHASNMTKAWASAKAVVSLTTGAPTTLQGPVSDSKEISHEKSARLIDQQIQLLNIHFAYNSKPVLRDLNMTIERGQFIGIVGPSGSGKSTILQLLERFYEPDAGDFLIDGTSALNTPVATFRDSISLVPQQPALVEGSIRFNVALGCRKGYSATDEEVRDALRIANILDFVEALPEGMHTQIGGKGTSLSGGQKQRIAIARAMIRQPELLLLDEFTSALDSTSERQVQQAINDATHSRTTIAIAHRIATIQHADVIFVVENGQVVEKGTHAALMQAHGKYYNLAKDQI